MVLVIIGKRKFRKHADSPVYYIFDKEKVIIMISEKQDIINWFVGVVEHHLLNGHNDKDIALNQFKAMIKDGKYDLPF